MRKLPAPHDGPDRLRDLGDERVLRPVAAPDQRLAEREVLDPRGRERRSRHMVGDREVGKDAVGESQAYELDLDDAVRYLVSTLQRDPMVARLALDQVAVG